MNFNRLILKKYYSLRSKREFFNYNFMKKNEYKSLEENKLVQNENLYNLLKHTFETVPFYSKYSNYELTLDKVEDCLKELPIITKDIIKNRYDSLISNSKSNNTYINTSGGSTGEPVVLLQDIPMMEKGNASKWFFNSWSGRDVGQLQIKLWGSERDIFGQNQSIKSKILNRLQGNLVLNTFRLTDEKMLEYIKIINKKRPPQILAYVQSIFEIAQFIDRNNIRIKSPGSIMTSAGILYPEHKEYIEKIFQCKVFNRYGSREVGDMACSCEEGCELHINSFNHYIEILNNENQECSVGETGRIVVTLLSNYSMPLIRYEIGDLAVKSDKICSCGRGFPMLTKVIGRTTDLFTNVNGDKIDGEYFTHLFYFHDFIEKFQVIQEKLSEIVIKIVLKKNTNIEDYDYIFEDISNKIKLVMTSHCNVSFLFVNTIETNDSGKYRYTISNIK